MCFWTDYGSTFTEGDVEGQATMTIDPPDLKLGDASWITHAIGMSTGANSGWSKTSGGEPHFSFEVEVLNSGTETVGTFKVGLLYLDGNPVGVDVCLFRTKAAWAAFLSRWVWRGPCGRGVAWYHFSLPS